MTLFGESHFSAKGQAGEKFLRCSFPGVDKFYSPRLGLALGLS